MRSSSCRDRFRGNHCHFTRPRRRHRRRQGKGRALRRLPRRERRLADGEHALAGRPARPVHPVAARLFPRRCAQERADAADRRTAQQRGHPQSRRLFRFAAAAEAARPTRTRTCRRRAPRPPPGAAVQHAISTTMPAPRRPPALPASARTISARRCATTSQASVRAEARRRWPRSPIPSAKKRSSRSRIISLICSSACRLIRACFETRGVAALLSMRVSAAV